MFVSTDFVVIVYYT